MKIRKKTLKFFCRLVLFPQATLFKNATKFCVCINKRSYKYKLKQNSMSILHIECIELYTNMQDIHSIKEPALNVHHCVYSAKNSKIENQLNRLVLLYNNGLAMHALHTYSSVKMFEKLISTNLCID